MRWFKKIQTLGRERPTTSVSRAATFPRSASIQAALHNRFSPLYRPRSGVGLHALVRLFSIEATVSESPKWPPAPPCRKTHTTPMLTDLNLGSVRRRGIDIYFNTGGPFSENLKDTSKRSLIYADAVSKGRFIYDPRSRQMNKTWQLLLHVFQNGGKIIRAVKDVIGCHRYFGCCSHFWLVNKVAVGILQLREFVSCESSRR